jgi:hypothetical protein
MTTEFLPDVTEDRYHADQLGFAQPSLSHSGIVTMLQGSPLHCWTAHPKLNPAYRPEELDGAARKARDLGRACHVAVLEPAAFARKIEVISADDWRTKEAKERRDAATAAGMTPILSGWCTDMQPVVRAATAFLASQGYTQGQNEVTGVWQEEQTLCKLRADLLIPDQAVCIDYKLTQESAKPEAVARRIAQIGYDVQARWYQRGLRAITGEDWQFYFLTQEWDCPEAISLVALDPLYDRLGDEKCDRALMLWRKCLASNTWPGYPAGVVHASPPAWELARWEEAVQTGDGLSLEERMLLGSQA